MWFWRILFFALLGGVSLFGQASIQLKPSEAEGWIGTPVQVDVWIDHAQNLGAFQFELIWGSHIIHVDTAWIGPFLGSTGRTVIPVGPVIDNSGYPGKLTFGSASFGTAPGPDSSGILAHVVFIPKGVGSTTVEFKNVVLSDVNGTPLSVVQVVNGFIRVHSYDSTLVTNTRDSGPGSLREALNYANYHPGPDTIRFRIPAADPGCDTMGVCTIHPTDSFVLSDSGTVIDGYTQPGACPNSNPFGQSINAVLKVVVDGSSQQQRGFLIYSSDNVVRGLVISGFRDWGIGFLGERARCNRIEGNFIGTDATGTVARANGGAGVLIGTYASENTVGGIDPAARNLISGNTQGVVIGPWGRNLVQGNYIGTDVTSVSPLGNSIGVRIVNVSQNNLIGGAGSGAENLIAFNMTGILVDGQYGEAYYNTFSRNRIHSNTVKGISLQSGGNQSISAPAITSVTPTQVAGTAVAHAKVEVFSDADGQGAVFEGATTADAAGNWSLSKPEGFTGPYVTATATDTLGNTSEFSSPVLLETGVEDFTEAKNPKAFALYPAYPNPFNPVTTISYHVKEHCRVVLEVIDLRGKTVLHLVDEKHQPGAYTVRFDARGLPSGIYFYRIRMGEFHAVKKMVLMK